MERGRADDLGKGDSVRIIASLLATPDLFHPQTQLNAGIFFTPPPTPTPIRHVNNCLLRGHT